jgi:hypothetical protein
MDLTPYVDALRQELATAAEAGGPEARELAERLTAPLESAVRLVLLDALSAAAEEITRDLAPGSVDLRLRGREPSFVVALPPGEDLLGPDPDLRGGAAGVLPPAPPDGDEGATARVNLRLSDGLKTRVEEAAAQAGLSVNAWLVRAAAAALAPPPGCGHDRTERRGSQRYVGWVR